MNRFVDAENIVDPGASNPAGVARTLVEAIDQCRSEGKNPKDCPACGLIAHQLYNILGCTRYDYGELNEYGEELKKCRELANAKRETDALAEQSRAPIRCPKCESRHFSCQSANSSASEVVNTCKSCKNIWVSDY